ncbi:unnamed protein product [Arctogadus glacialis]
MKKKSYDVEIHVEGQEVKASTCSCAIGRAKCHHVAALLIWAENNLTRTDVECVWKRAPAPKTDEVTAKRVSVIAPSTSQAGIKRPFTQEDREWTLNSLAQLGRFTGLVWILAPETPQTVPIKTFDGVVTSSGYGNAEDKALYVLSSFAVSPQEKEAIERATVGQTKNALWMAYRHKRITASNFSLVLAALKRNSYPPSLFKTLLGQYNLKQGSHCTADCGEDVGDCGTAAIKSCCKVKDATIQSELHQSQE